MSTLVGTAVLLRLALRIDRVRLAVWVLGIVALIVVSAASVVGLYASEAEIASYVALVGDNATMIAVNGPGIGFDRPNVGVIFANETVIWAVISMALMNVFLMIRHTRGEEDAERAELVRARRVGRHAPIAAAALLVVLASVVVSALCLVGLVVTGLDLVGSIAFCATMLAVGVLFAALALLAAQVAGTARGALGISLAALGAAYGLRAAGDVADSWLSWLSPMGWAHRVRPYAGERWWMLAVFVATGLVVGLVGVVLADRRDLGSGLVAQRAGPERGAMWSSTLGGLAWRLQRGSLVGWSVGLALLGVVYGSVGRDIEQMFEDNPDFEQFIAQMQGASITDSYLSYTLALGAMMTGGFAIAAVLRLRSEESDGRAELLLGTPTSRWRWMRSHVVVSLLGSVVVLAASGLGTGAGLAIALGEPGQLVRMVLASIALTPAVAVLVGLTALLVGVAPRLAMLAWVPLGFVVLVGLFADVFELPRWVRLISPFEHATGPPASSFDPLVAIVLAGVAALAVAVGALALSRRDLPSV